MTSRGSAIALCTKPVSPPCAMTLCPASLQALSTALTSAVSRGRTMAFAAIVSDRQMPAGRLDTSVPVKTPPGPVMSANFRTRSPIVRFP